MTRKDYQLIALVLKDARQRHPANWPTHDLIARSLARQLSIQSPTFDYARFLEACDYGQNQIQATPLGF